MTAGPATAAGDSAWASGEEPPADSIGVAKYLLRLAGEALSAARGRRDEGAVRVLSGRIDGLLDVLGRLLAERRDEELARIVTDWVRSGEPRAVPRWPAQAPGGSP